MVSFWSQGAGLRLSQRPKAQSHSSRTHCHNRQKLSSSLPQRTQQTKPQDMSERNRLLLFQHSYAASRITKQGGIHQKVLTGYFQRGISANGLSQVIAGNASVNTLVGFAAASVNDAQEKKGAARQQHAVGSRVILISFNVLAVFIPLHRGRGPTLCLAVQGGRLTL